MHLNYLIGNPQYNSLKIRLDLEKISAVLFISSNC